MGSSTIALRPMTHHDIPAGLRLSSLAGWNQIEADWEMILDASQAGSYVASYAGVDVGTVTLVNYQDKVGWIGMVLVDPAFRRRGVGTQLLEAAVRSAKAAQTLWLDATPQGERLYRKMGFNEVLHLDRWTRSSGDSGLRAGIGASRIYLDQLHQVFELDTPVFGAHRETVLNSLFHKGPQLAWCLYQGSQIAGYCLGRTGREYTQVGPLISKTQDTAQQLLLTVLPECKQDVIIDVPRQMKTWTSWLQDLGFKPIRAFLRMSLGFTGPLGQVEHQYAAAGPELG